MGQYDTTLKLLVDSNPEAMARFVLHEIRYHLVTLSRPGSCKAMI